MLQKYQRKLTKVQGIILHCQEEKILRTCHPHPAQSFVIESGAVRLKHLRLLIWCFILVGSAVFGDSLNLEQ